MNLTRTHASFFAIATLALIGTQSTASAQNVTFTDVTSSTGISYARTPSTRNATAISFREGSLIVPMTPMDIPLAPMRNPGIPGVAIFDYDRDGDLDLYLTNGPGSANSLLANQLAETGNLEFTDVTSTAFVSSSAQDSNGVCFADIDNDGDEDLFVVAHTGANHLYENNGNGTFTEISGNSDFVQNGEGGNSCVFGDVDNDGKVDLFIARGYDLESLGACFVQEIGTAKFQHNELYLNIGNNVFSNVSETSGIKDMYNYPEGNAGFTWSAALVDYDLDGDLDLFNADDHCAAPVAKYGGVDRGYMQVWDNNGSGVFTNVTGLGETGTTDNSAGSWMGISFADYNNDGRMDFHTTNFGDWARPFVGAPYEVGDESSAWFYQNAAGTFDREFAGLISTPFGWGTVSEDIDNDGDTDVVFHGALDLAFSGEASNAGATLLNDATGMFSYDPNATSIEHNRRTVSGVAAGDLNNDGFVDIVSVSSEDYPAFVPLIPYAAAGIDRGSAFDPTASFVPLFAETAMGSGQFVWTGLSAVNGGVAVEINNGESNNNSVSISALGTVNITSLGRVNRDGIGAVMMFTPKGMPTAMKPVAAGSSHASSDSLEQNFGLGSKRKGTLEILWPGGVRNKLYNVRAGEKITVPEIPCSYDAQWQNTQAYRRCVRESLRELKQSGNIDQHLRARLLSSAMRAYSNH